MVERNGVCPECKRNIFYTDQEYVYCLWCDWKEKAKRENDKKLPSLKELENAWGK